MKGKTLYQNTLYRIRNNETIYAYALILKKEKGNHPKVIHLAYFESTWGKGFGIATKHHVGMGGEGNKGIIEGIQIHTNGTLEFEYKANKNWHTYKFKEGEWEVVPEDTPKH